MDSLTVYKPNINEVKCIFASTYLVGKSVKLRGSLLHGVVLH